MTAEPSPPLIRSITHVAGKVDYIFVAATGAITTDLSRDTVSRDVLIASHAACKETGQWPSDHGMEALQVLASPAGDSQRGDDVKEPSGGSSSLKSSV